MVDGGDGLADGLVGGSEILVDRAGVAVEVKVGFAFSGCEVLDDLDVAEAGLHLPEHGLDLVARFDGEDAGVGIGLAKGLDPTTFGAPSRAELISSPGALAALNLYPWTLNWPGGRPMTMPRLRSQSLTS